MTSVIVRRCRSGLKIIIIIILEHQRVTYIRLPGRNLTLPLNNEHPMFYILRCHARYLIEEDVVVNDKILDEFPFVLDRRQTNERVGFRRAEQSRSKHDRKVLSAHHVLLLLVRHSEQVKATLQSKSHPAE